VRRDPFAPLLGKQPSGGGTPMNLPAGKPGLLISSLRISGIVSGPSGMIAIVSNAQDRVYFLREGDRLYDGQVEHITMDGISFHQAGKDPFGNAVEREVAKRLNSTPGELQ
jgi:Tfp pilus assembly protein PilP